MNKDDIIKLAREAEKYADKHTPQYVTVPNEWQEIRDEHFANLVAEHATAEEREECAKLCEEDAFVDQWKGLTEAAKRIRARGNT